MIPVEQTILLPPDGNCFAACLASIFEMNLEDLPNFTGSDWCEQWNEWLEPYGIALMNLTLDQEQFPRYRKYFMPGYTILAANSPRGDWLHAVVCYDSEVVWDPHPQREMGLGEWREVTILCVRDAKRLVTPPDPILDALRDKFAKIDALTDDELRAVWERVRE